MYMMSILLALVCMHSPAPPTQWGGPHSGITQTRIELLTDQEAFAKVWATIHDGSLAELPEVDFSRTQLVLACRGREPGVPRVTGVQIETTKKETILSIEANEQRPRGEPALGVTTAWGIILVPKDSKRIRVRYNANGNPNGKPEWETIAVLDPRDSNRSGPRRGPEHYSQAELERMRRPWTKELAEPPRYFISHGYNPKWSDAITKGIDVAREYLGNYGPVQIYIVGQEDDELSDPQHREAIAQAFCSVHNQGSDRPLEHCLATDGAEMAQKAVDNITEAFMTMAMDANPPTAELVFINAHTMGGVALMPTRSIHEYAHVYQKAFNFTPTWMMEGGAEFLAAHLGEKNGWGNRDETMTWYARHLDGAQDLNFTIRDMEEIETAKPEVAQWHRELAYEAGAWAVAYIISRSPDKGIRTYYQTFYPLAHTKGWQAALCEYTGAKSVDAFYEDFQSFITQPLSERVSLLATLKN